MDIPRRGAKVASRRVSVFLPVAGEPAVVRAAFAGDPGRWLPALRPCGADRWSVDLRFHGIGRTVEVRVGGVWQLGDAVWRSMVWTPLPDAGDPTAAERWLPTFTGEIGLHVRRRAGSLVLTGSYHPPGAALGGIADAVVLKRVAEHTANAFLRDVASRLAVPVGAGA